MKSETNLRIFFAFVELESIFTREWHLIPEAEFKEFEPRLNFETRLKYGWFHLKLYSMFQDSSQRSIETDGFDTRLKFIKFGLSEFNH